MSPMMTFVSFLLLYHVMFINGLLLSTNGEFQYMFGIPYSYANSLDAVKMYVACEETTAISILGPEDIPQKHVTIQPGSSHVSLMDWNFGYLTRDSISYNNTFLVTSDSEIQIHVFFISNYYSEGYLVLPITQKSTDYLVPAHSKSTYVTMTNGLTPTELDVKNLNYNKTFNVKEHLYTGTIDTTLPARSTMQIKYYNPTTAVKINSSKPVAVQTYNHCSYLCNMSMEQFLPVPFWKNKFILGRLNSMPNYTVRIVSSGNNNRIQIGSEGVSLDEGQIYEKFYDSDSVVVVESTLPVLVLQYSEPYNNTVGGNAVITVPATEQFLSQYNFTVPDGFGENHVTVTIETKHVSGLRLDGHIINGAVEKRSSMADGYSVVRFPVDTGLHKLTHAYRVRFGAIMFGFGYYRAAYGLPINLDLTNSKDIIVKLNDVNK